MPDPIVTKRIPQLEEAVELDDAASLVLQLGDAPAQRVTLAAFISWVYEQGDFAATLAATVAAKEAAEDTVAPITAAAADIAKLSAAANENFNGPIIRDTGNIHGGGAGAIYVPQTYYYNRNGETFGPVTLTPESAEVAGHVKVTPGAGAWVAWLDISVLRAAGTAALDVATLGAVPDAALGTDVLPILAAYGATVWSPYELRETRDPAQTRHVALKAALVEQVDLDGSRSLILPGLIGYQDGAYDSSADPTGAVFEHAIPLTGGEVTHYLNARSESLVAGAAGAVVGGQDAIVLGRSYLGRFHSPYRVIRPGQASPNHFPWGADMSLTPLLYQTTAPAACRTDEALARGFAVGVVNPAGATYAGGPLDKTRDQPHALVRAYVELAEGETAVDRPATLGLFVLAEYGSSAQGNVDLTFERMIGDRLAAYVYRGQIVTSAPVSWFWLGGFNNPDWRLCGLQAHWSATPVDWVDRLDYPDQASAALPPVLHVTEGQPVSLDVRSAMASFADVDVTWSSSQAVAPRRPWFDTRPCIDLDPDRVGPTVDVHLRARGGSNLLRTTRSITIERAPSAVAAGAVNVLAVTDSLGVRQLMHLLKLELEAYGRTPAFIGTVPGHGAVEGVYDGPLGECRGSRRFTDYTGQTTDLLQPVAAGDEAAYLALSTDDKIARNPFLRVATGGDDPDWVFDDGGVDYIFDMAFYLSRWTPDLATPDVVVFCLGTNDFLNPGAPGMLPGVQLGLDILYGQTRAALPAAHIAFINPAIGDGALGAVHKANAHAVRRAILNKVQAERTGGDLNVHFVDAAMRQTAGAGWGQTVREVDSCGINLNELSDDIHFSGVNRHGAVATLSSLIRYRF